MFSSMLGKIFQNSSLTSEMHAYLKYVESSYPSNHTYKIQNKKLIPKRKLASRYKVIKNLLPQPLTSLVDISCSKGFFVLAASEISSCTRSLGIDINGYDVEVCSALANHLQNSRVRFEKLRLHELAANIDKFGGPFQTVLVLNMYQYLYFGSDPFPATYLDHETIFKDLRKICHQRVIFNNRVNVEDCQNTVCVERAGSLGKNYSEEKILAAASKYFTVTNHGEFGRYPLWTLEVK